MQQIPSITVTIPNPTAGQLAALTDILNGVGQTTATPTKKSGKRTQPESTVSDEEDEDFGTKKLSKEDLDEEESEEEDDENESDEDTDEDSITFEQVKEALNTYGDSKPLETTAILKGFGVKSTKELKASPKKWEPVYRKIMAKIKASKKGR